jgi:hypothetical protein
VRSDIVIHGMNANSRVGKFIGGVGAYKAAGGTMLDESFLDLFKKEDDDQRMRDVSIDPRSWSKSARPSFTTASPRWCSRNIRSPVASCGPTSSARTASIIRSQRRRAAWCWSVTGGIQTQRTTVKRAKRAAKEFGATVLPIVSIDDDGKPQLWPGKFHVGKDAWEKVTPADKRDESRGYVAPTPEEVAARNREHEIGKHMRRLYGRSLVGETPGFGVMDCRYDRHNKRVVVELVRFDETNADIDASDQWSPRFTDEAIGPFREEATARADAAIAEKAEAEAAAKAAAEEAAAGSSALLEEIELLALADWPHEVMVTDAEGDAALVVTRAIEEGQDVLECEQLGGDTWTTDNVLELVDVIRDYLSSGDGTLSVVRDAPPVVLSENDQAAVDAAPTIDDLPESITEEEEREAA